jgi:hypothetical protein
MRKSCRVPLYNANHVKDHLLSKYIDALYNILSHLHRTLHCKIFSFSNDKMKFSSKSIDKYHGRYRTIGL